MTHIKDQDLVTASYCTELYKLGGNYLELSFYQKAIVAGIKAAFENTNDTTNFDKLDKAIARAITKTLLSDAKFSTIHLEHELRTLNAYCANQVYQFFKAYPPSDWILVISDVMIPDNYKSTSFLFFYDMVLRKRDDSRLHFHIIDFIKDVELGSTTEIFPYKFSLISKFLKKTFNNYKIKYNVFSFKDYNASIITLPVPSQKEIVRNNNITLGKYYEIPLNIETFPKRIICYDKKCPKRKECMKDV